LRSLGVLEEYEQIGQLLRCELLFEALRHDRNRTIPSHFDVVMANTQRFFGIE